MMVEAPQSRHIVAMIAGTQMQKVPPDYLQISLLNHSQIAPPLLSFHAVRGIVSVRRSAMFNINDLQTFRPNPNSRLCPEL
jgi:hypothetical protein